MITAKIFHFFSFFLVLSLAMIAQIPLKGIQANTAFTVNTPADTHDNNPGDGVCADSIGACSLRAAIEEANSLAGTDLIDLPANTYPLSLGEIVITSDLTIQGAGHLVTLINASLDGRVFKVDKPGGVNLIQVHFVGVTIQNGSIVGNGGGIWNNETLILSDCALQDNQAVGDGGGLFNTYGIVSIENSLIQENDTISSHGGGGGIYTMGGSLTITETLVATNSVTASSGLIYGGGINSIDTNVTLISSDFRGNSMLQPYSMTAAHGGGIRTSFGSLIIIDSLFENNTVLAPDSMADSDGGAIYCGDTDLTIDQTIVRDNYAEIGGGLCVYSPGVLISNSQFENNSSDVGGGIYFGGSGIPGNIINCSISNNVAEDSGGGIYHVGGDLIIDSSVIQGNYAGEYSGGGGIMIHVNGVLTLLNSTISENLSDGYGGGIYSTGQCEMSHSTIANNVADANGDYSGGGGGLFIDPYLGVTLRNVILADNLDYIGDGPDCLGGTLSSLGYTLVETTTGCTYVPAAGDVISVDPQLGPLADNGGDTLTHALPYSSPAVDSGTCVDVNGNLVTTDQRGVLRPQLLTCDIGAFEYEPQPLSKYADVEESQPGELITYTVIIYNNLPVTLTNGVLSDTLPLEVSFIGPVTIDPPEAGTPGTQPPMLAYDLLIMSGQMVWISFPVMVNTGLPLGTNITNTASMTATQIIDPWLAASVFTVANALPIAQSDVYTTTVNIPLVVDVPGVLGNDIDLNGDALTAVLDTGPSHGVLSLAVDGSFVYTPSLNFSGTDSFTYITNDPYSASIPAEVTLFITSSYVVGLPIVWK